MPLRGGGHRNWRPTEQEAVNFVDCVGVTPLGSFRLATPMIAYALHFLRPRFRNFIRLGASCGFVGSR